MKDVINEDYKDKDDENITSSTCCKAQAVPSFDERNWFCSRCGLTCKVTEICSHCHGTGYIVEYRYDNDAHIMMPDELVKCTCQ